MTAHVARRAPDRSEPARGRPGRRSGVPAAAGAPGFTLIEVLVAVAIVAVALAAGSRAASSVTDTSQRLSDVTLAQWCADNELTELRLTATFPNVGKTPFDCSELGRAFKGTLVVQPTPNPSFRRVDTVVADDTGRALLTISTVVSR